MKPTTQNSILLPVAVIFLGICILGGGAFFYFATRPVVADTSATNVNSNTTVTTPARSVSASEILYAIAAEVNKDLTKDDQGQISSEGSFLWEDKDGYLFEIKNATSARYRILVPNDRSWGSEEIAKQALNKTIVTIFDKHMATLGFTMDTINTSKNLADNSLGGYQKAYVKGDVVCIFAGDSESTQEENGMVNVVSTSNYKSYVGSSISCKDSLKTDFDAVKPVLSGLGIKGSWINLENTDISRLSDGDFLTFGVGQYPRSIGGYKIIAKKEGGKYRKIYEGQSSIPCDVATKEKVPVYIAKCDPEEDAARALYGE